MISLSVSRFLESPVRPTLPLSLACHHHQHPSIHPSPCTCNYAINLLWTHKHSGTLWCIQKRKKWEAVFQLFHEISITRSLSSSITSWVIYCKSLWVICSARNHRGQDKTNKRSPIKTNVVEAQFHLFAPPICLSSLQLLPHFLNQQCNYHYSVRRQCCKKGKTLLALPKDNELLFAKLLWQQKLIIRLQNLPPNTKVVDSSSA